MERLIAFLAHAVYMGTPLLFGTVGEIQNEKSGHLNLGVEGIMAMGACAGFMTAYKTGSLVLALIMAFIVGMAVSLIYAFLTITMMANQNVTGLTLTIFGTGLSNFIGEQMITASETGNLKLPENVSAALKNIKIPLLGDIPVLGGVLFNQNIFTYISIVIAIIMFIYLNKTKTGLNLRTIGESPAVADAVGIKRCEVQVHQRAYRRRNMRHRRSVLLNGNKRRRLDGKQRKRTGLDSRCAGNIRSMEPRKGNIRRIHLRRIHGAEILLPQRPGIYRSRIIL